MSLDSSLIFLNLVYGNVERQRGMVAKSNAYFLPGIPKKLLLVSHKLPSSDRRQSPRKFCSHDSDWPRQELFWLLVHVLIQDGIALLDVLLKQQSSHASSLDYSVDQTPLNRL